MCIFQEIKVCLAHKVLLELLVCLEHKVCPADLAILDLKVSPVDLDEQEQLDHQVSLVPKEPLVSTCFHNLDTQSTHKYFPNKTITCGRKYFS